MILPGLLRVRPILTPLAACGLVIIMIGATVVTLAGGEVVPLVVGLLCTTVAYGRRSLGDRPTPSAAAPSWQEPEIGITPRIAGCGYAIIRHSI